MLSRTGQWRHGCVESAPWINVQHSVSAPFCPAVSRSLLLLPPLRPFMQPLTHPSVMSPIHPFCHPSIHPLCHPAIRLVTHSFVQSPIHLFSHPSIRLVNPSSVQSPIRPFSHPFVCLVTAIYLFSHRSIECIVLVHEQIIRSDICLSVLFTYSPPTHLYLHSATHHTPHLPTPSSIQISTYPPIHTPIHSATNPPTHPSTHMFIHSATHPSTHLFIQVPTHLPSHPTHSSIQLPTHPRIQLATLPHAYPPTYPPTDNYSAVFCLCVSEESCCGKKCFVVTVVGLFSSSPSSPFRQVRALRSLGWRGRSDARAA